MDEDDSRKHPSSSSRSGTTNTKSPIHRLKENHHEQPETPRTPKTTDDVLTSEILNVSRECCDPSSTRQDMTLALQAVPSIAAKPSSSNLPARYSSDSFKTSSRTMKTSKRFQNPWKIWRCPRRSSRRRRRVKMFESRVRRSRRQRPRRGERVGHSIRGHALPRRHQHHSAVDQRTSRQKQNTLVIAYVIKK